MDTVISGSTLAANLRDAADWLDAHPDLPAPLFSVNGYTEYGVTLNFHVTTDAEAEELFALTDGGTDHRYEDGDYVRIATGTLGSDRLSLSVAVDR
jgi:hypothetical protein